MNDDRAPSAMIVDDDALIVMEACDILGEFGFDCLEAMSGAEAIEVLEAQADQVTLLFSDVNMPGEIDGFGVARHVAEHWPWIEIVIASGMVLPNAGDMPDKATFIAKPFNKHTVRAHIDQILPDGKKPEPLRQN